MKQESRMKQEERDKETEIGDKRDESRILNSEEKVDVLAEPVVLPSEKHDGEETEQIKEDGARSTEDRILKADGNGSGLNVEGREEEKQPFGVGQFVKLLVFGVLFVTASYFLGSAFRFVFDGSFFFLSWAGETWIEAVMLTVFLVVFLVVAGVTMVAYERSFLAFIPTWALASLGFFVGVGEYGVSGGIVGAGFALGLMLFFIVVKGDLKDSFKFSVRQAFSSIGIFLTILFVAVAGGYYMKVEQTLSSSELLPEEIMRPVYELEKRVMSTQLGVPEDEVEDRLKQMEHEGKKVSFFGLFELDSELQTKTMYDWMHGKVSELASEVIPYVAGGLAIILAIVLSVVIAPVSMISRGVIFVVMETLIVIGFFKKKKVMREAEVLEI